MLSSHNTKVTIHEEFFLSIATTLQIVTIDVIQWIDDWNRQKWYKVIMQLDITIYFYSRRIHNISFSLAIILPKYFTISHNLSHKCNCTMKIIFNKWKKVVKCQLWVVFWGTLFDAVHFLESQHLSLQRPTSGGFPSSWWHQVCNDREFHDSPATTSSSSISLSRHRSHPRVAH